MRRPQNFIHKKTLPLPKCKKEYNLLAMGEEKNCLQNLERRIFYATFWFEKKNIQDFLGTTIKQKFAIGCGQSLEWIPLRDVEIQKGWVQHNSRRRFTSLFYSTKYTSSSKVSVFDKWFRARNEAEKWSFLKIWALEKKEVLETTKRGGVLVFTGQFYLQTGTTEALRHQQTENKWFRNIPERSGI